MNNDTYTPDPKGLYKKYNVTERSGKPVEGFTFVLRLADPHARVALQAYADSVRAENFQLAADIEDAIRSYPI